MTLNLDLHDEKVTPLNVAGALIDFVIDLTSCENDKDINFIHELSEHLDVACHACMRNRMRGNDKNE